MINVDCRNLKEEGLNNLKEKVNGKNINFYIIQVEGDIASNIYVKNKLNASKKALINAHHLLFPSNVTEEELINKINELNNDNNVHGIMVQLPLPSHLDENKIINYINPNKDVDGLTYENLGKILSGENALRPCTAEGVMTILDKVKGLDNLSGLNAVIIGRSKLVGLPLLHMLLKYDVTPSICHTKTKNLNELTKNADILITAAGSTEPFIDHTMVKDGSIVIDVSISKDDNGKMHGDVMYDDVKEKVLYITPVPGGVGQMTVLKLLENVYKAYKLNNN